MWNVLQKCFEIWSFETCKSCVICCNELKKSTRSYLINCESWSGSILQLGGSFMIGMELVLKVSCICIWQVLFSVVRGCMGLVLKMCYIIVFFSPFSVLMFSIFIGIVYLDGIESGKSLIRLCYYIRKIDFHWWNFFCFHPRVFKTCPASNPWQVLQNIEAWNNQINNFLSHCFSFAHQILDDLICCFSKISSLIDFPFSYIFFDEYLNKVNPNCQKVLALAVPRFNSIQLLNSKYNFFILGFE